MTQGMTALVGALRHGEKRAARHDRRLTREVRAMFDQWGNGYEAADRRKKFIHDLLEGYCTDCGYYVGDSPCYCNDDS